MFMQMRVDRSEVIEERTLWWQRKTKESLVQDYWDRVGRGEPPPEPGQGWSIGTFPDGAYVLRGIQNGWKHFEWAAIVNKGVLDVVPLFMLKGDQMLKYVESSIEMEQSKKW